MGNMQNKSIQRSHRDRLQDLKHWEDKQKHARDRYNPQSRDYSPRLPEDRHFDYNDPQRGGF